MSNVVIIGAGPAGVSAALYTARAGIDTKVFTTGRSALEKADKIQNYYGFEDAISGKELLRAGIEGAKKVGVVFEEEEVTGIGYTDRLTVQTVKGVYPADCVLIATGASRKTPAVRGLRELEGRGVSYCAVCDAFFYRGKSVAVLGSGEYALHEIRDLLPAAASVTLLTNEEAVTAKMPKEVQIVEKKIAQLQGEEALERILFADGSSMPADGLFVAQGVAGSAALARKIGAQIDGTRILVNENMETSIPGLYAAGDCTGGLLQVSKAVYEGAKAGTEIVKRLRRQNTSKEEK